MLVTFPITIISNLVRMSWIFAGKDARSRKTVASVFDRASLALVLLARLLTDCVSLSNASMSIEGKISPT